MDDLRTNREGGVRATKFALKSLFIVILVAVGLFGALALYRSWASFDETIRRGDIIVQALNKYYANHHQYPALLTDLSPRYLEDIPAPTWGLQMWKYTSLPNEFEIGVDESNSTGNGDALWLKYLGPRLGWQTGD
jgi:hypothetical protein